MLDGGPYAILGRPFVLKLIPPYLWIRMGKISGLLCSVSAVKQHRLNKAAKYKHSKPEISGNLVRNTEGKDNPANYEQEQKSPNVDSPENSFPTPASSTPFTGYIPGNHRKQMKKTGAEMALK